MCAPVRFSLLPDDFSVAKHRPHPLHGLGTNWPETNCALDMWIELLSLTGHEPKAAGSVAFASDFVGDHWVMLEFSREDLRSLYGIDVVEFGPWKPTLEHLLDHLPDGRLLTMESDAYWLPDTVGTDYHEQHTKTGIVVLELDPRRRTVSYLHNAVLATLGPEDFDGALGLAGSVSPRPYLEMVRFHRPPADLRAAALERMRIHLGRRPEDNPVPRLGARLSAGSDELKEAGLDLFHKLAFATVRQLGTSAQLAAGFLDWLEDPALKPARDDFIEVASLAHRGQFAMARVARGRSAISPTLLDDAAARWASGIDAVLAWDDARD